MKLFLDSLTARNSMPLYQMASPLSSYHKKKVEWLLVSCGLLKRDEAEKAVRQLLSGRLHGDGSNRQFFRLSYLKKSICIVIIPAGEEKNDLAESYSAWRIGNHLRGCNVPVPEVYGWDEETGILLFEDLGDVRLHELIAAERKGSPLTGEGLQAYYLQVIKELVHMQCAGAVDFDESWCWDSSRYDQKLMLERESGYYLRAFWQGLLGQEIVPGVHEELVDIAAKAADAGTDYFLHRDFQCRNIMFKNGYPRIIDFQGGRKGPLGYDLASLLIDPYASLPSAVEQELLHCYMKIIIEYTGINRNTFLDHYNYLAFQRNMQIVGAFSFLYKIRGKIFFKDYISPALSSLASRLEEPQFKQYAIVNSMVKQGINLFSGR